jgi:hypothetical protein
MGYVSNVADLVCQDSWRYVHILLWLSYCRMTGEIMEGGPGFDYLEVCMQDCLPRRTEAVALVSGHVYAAKEEKRPVQLTVVLGRVERCGA